MIEKIVKDIVVVSTNQRLGEVTNIGAGTYAVVVNEKNAPIALATNEDLITLNEPDSKSLVQVVSHLPAALVAGRRIAIEKLINAASGNPKLVSRGTVLMNPEGVAGVHPVGDLISHMLGLQADYSITIAQLNAAIGTSGRAGELPGKGRRPCIPIVCASCGFLNCLKYIPAKDELMPNCENPNQTTHPFAMMR
jgi:hypothetical protein